MYRFVRSSAIFAAILCTAITASKAQSAQDLVKKSKEIMKNAKTVQLHMIVENDLGAKGKSSQFTDIKMVPGKRLAMSGGGTSKDSPLASGQPRTQVYDDGTTLYAYLPSKKQYRKMPSQAAKIANISNTIDGKIAGINLVYKKLPDTNFDGTKCYAIQADLPGSKGATKTIMYIDKSTGLPRGIRTTATQGKEVILKTTITMKDVKLNAPIPESAFKFKPPAGSTEIKGPPPQNGGGAKKPGS
jgi:outer membrane lipoprotein-sorting protein